MIKLEALPMLEALEFWKSKIQLAPSEYRKLSDEAKIKAFAVSGIAKGAELETVFNAITDAIEKGTALEDFKKECASIFEKRGWVGERAWRIDNIFRTNIQTAYNVGRYSQMMDVVKDRPLWMYDAVNDRRTRPAHRAMDGKVFPAGHPVWDTWYPPNGFRCRCSVTTLSEDQVKKMGKPVETEDPTNTLVEYTNPKTGITHPAFQLIPDPGFSHHPGKSVWGGIVDNTMNMGFSEDPALLVPADYGKRKIVNVRPSLIPDFKGEFLPPGQPDDFYISEFKKRYGDEKAVAGPDKEVVILSLRSFLVNKSQPDNPEWKFRKAGHGECIPVLEEMITQPFEIWLTPQKDVFGKIRLTKRYISVWKTENEKLGGMAVFELVAGVLKGVTAFIPMKKGGFNLKYLEDQRQGILLWERR